MRYRTFGQTGWNVSEIGFGAWAIGADWGHVSESDALEALHKSIDLGVNFIDTADVYGDGRSERLVSQVLKERSEQRDRFHPSICLSASLGLARLLSSHESSRSAPPPRRCPAPVPILLYARWN